VFAIRIEGSDVMVHVPDVQASGGLPCIGSHRGIWSALKGCDGVVRR